MLKAVYIYIYQFYSVNTVYLPPSSRSLPSPHSEDIGMFPRWLGRGVHWFLGGELFRKIADIKFIRNYRFEWGGNLPGQHSCPVYNSEPGMGLDLCCAICSQPLLRVFLHEGEEEVSAAAG